MIVGVGIDLVDIARVQRLIDGKGQRALDRLFTADEVADATSRARPALHLQVHLIQHADAASPYGMAEALEAAVELARRAPFGIVYPVEHIPYRLAFPAMHLAARIAAKEAAFKALSGSDEARRIGWREVEVIAQSGGAPRLELHGRAQLRARELGVGRAHLSLSHTDTTAGAVVVLDRGGD